MRLRSFEVSTSTWIKDSHGLYDYEAQEDNYKKEKHYLKGNCKVYRDNINNQTVPLPPRRSSTATAATPTTPTPSSPNS